MFNATPRSVLKKSDVLKEKAHMEDWDIEK